MPSETALITTGSHVVVVLFPAQQHAHSGKNKGGAGSEIAGSYSRQSAALASAPDSATRRQAPGTAFPPNGSVWVSF
jgi:hypothetical protein